MQAITRELRDHFGQRLQQDNNNKKSLVDSAVLAGKKMCIGKHEEQDCYCIFKLRGSISNFVVVKR